MGDVIEAEWIDAPTDEQHIEDVREKIRSQLKYPKGAIDRDDHGQIVYRKPPLKSARNLARILAADPVFSPRLCMNTHKNAVEYDGATLADHHVTELRLDIARVYGTEWKPAEMQEMVVNQARLASYHPIKDYLERLKWDGVPRVDDFLIRLAGAPDTEITRIISRRWFISAIARVLRPGCKVDTVLVLAGPQGAGKSTLFAALAGSWFKDTALDLRSKDAYVNIQGAWIYEFAELATTRARDVETVKAFLSAPADHYRPPYGRNQVSQARQCVFVGTTNEATFLNDPTGARRFWPVTVSGRIKTQEIRAERDQLWAEALSIFNSNERWWLELNEEDMLLEAQHQYQTADPWAEVLRKWCAEPTNRSGNGWTSEHLLSEALHVPFERQQKYQVSRVGNVMRAIGFNRVRNRLNGERAYRWVLSDLSQL